MKDENDLPVSHTGEKQEPQPLVHRAMFDSLSKLSGFGYKYRD